MVARYGGLDLLESFRMCRGCAVCAEHDLVESFH